MRNPRLAAVHNKRVDPVATWRRETLARLVTVPAIARDEEWNRAFEAAFWPASLFLAKQWAHRGPDGHAFLQLVVVNEEPDARHALPASLVDYLIEHAAGLSLLDPKGNPSVVLPHGWVLSYRCFGRALEPRPKIASREHTLMPGQTFGLAELNDAFVPVPVRNAIRKYLVEEFGFAAPKGAVATMPDGRRRLVVDFEPARLGEARVAEAFAGLAWFMPPRLVYVRVDEWNAYPQMGSL